MKWGRRSTGGKNRHYLVFGGGLVGAAIDEAIARGGHWQATAMRWDWTDADQRRAQLAALPGLMGESARIDIIWAAGVSGFSSTDADMATETGHVAEVAALARTLSDQCPIVAFHLFSSIGGLFEGQSWIGAESQPRALRPYGRGKLEQEAMVLDLAPGIVPRIYRPSSVYGFTPNGRRGLFAAIIASTLTNRPAVIFGSPHTLRDYVFAQDIGDFLAGTLARPLTGETVMLLASGKPTSLSEAIATIEAQIGRRYYGRFDKAPHNALDMTVRMTALPPGLRRTPLRLGINLVHQSMLRSLISEAHAP